LGQGLQISNGDLVFFGRADQQEDSSVVRRDLTLVSGRDNFLQAMQVMIETPFGSDIFNVNYGFDLLGILSAPQTVGVIKSLIRLNIVKSLSQDNRVREITDVLFDDEPGFAEILAEQNEDENRRRRKLERRWQAVVVLQTISEGEVALRLEGTGLKT
jgi:phage baseplate assembly protein W